MSLAPLLAAPGPIVLHAFAALAAFALGLVQLFGPKGTLPHRVLGWCWATLMAGVAVSSFWIHTIRQFGPWSLIHLLSIFTLAMLPLALLHARRHRVASHRRAMIALFTGALVIAGVFTLYPGRIMARVVFRGMTAPLRAALAANLANPLARRRGTGVSISMNISGSD